MEKEDQKEPVVVLCRPEGARNVGAVCRGMKTMGFHHLVLVNPAPSARIPEEVREMALHAYDVFEKARVFSDLPSALAECRVSAAFARRQGGERKESYLELEDFRDRQAILPGPVALVFGNEKHGLTTEEVQACTLTVAIPTSPDFPSLNLAQAVQIACWELRNRDQTQTSKPLRRHTLHPTLTLKEGRTLALEVVQAFESLGFYKLGGKEKAQEIWRDLFTRAQLSPAEASWVRGTFGKLRGLSDPGSETSGQV